MIGYLFGGRSRAAAYNAAHTYLAPAGLALAGWAAGWPMLYPLALVWAAHIGFDRLLGYGLKYDEAFGATHLGWRGRGAPTARVQEGAGLGPDGLTSAVA